MKITMNDIDFIYEDSEQGIRIMVRTIEAKKENKTIFGATIKIDSIIFSCDWMADVESYSNREEAIVHTINKFYRDFCYKDVIYFRNIINTLYDALEEAKKLRFQQLNLFEDGSTRKTYRISKQVHKPSRREDKHRVSIYD